MESTERVMKYVYSLKNHLRILSQRLEYQWDLRSKYFTTMHCKKCEMGLWAFDTQ
jgi:hypothetical protein